MKAIILAGGTGSRLWPVTRAVSKQLIPVYDKPMVYYPLSTALLAGATDLAVIASPSNVEDFKRLLGDGSKFGIQITFLTQDEPRGLADAYLVAEAFLGGEESLLVLGDNLFHGQGLGSQLVSARKSLGAHIFGYAVSNPQDYGVVSFDSTGRVLSMEEKPKNPKSNIAIPGMYFLDGTASQRATKLSPSSRGELEITDLLRTYLHDGSLSISILPRTTVWLDTGNAEAMAEATEYVRVIQKRQNQMVCCPEEVAWRLGLITDENLKSSALELEKSAYGRYLAKLVGEKYV